MRTTKITITDRISRLVFRSLGALPLRLQRFLGGRPICIDGQELHPTVQLGALLLNKFGGKTFETKPVAIGREEVARQFWVVGDAIPVGSIRDFCIDGPHGKVPVRLYRPSQPKTDTPLIVYYHGGGWVLGDLGESDSVCRFLAAHAGVSILSVDYRLAPEHRFPQGLEDSLAAFDYAAAHAKELNCDPNLVGVAGESAGGNIAAVICLLATERQRLSPETLAPAFQILFQPVTDLSKKHPSYKLFSTGFLLTEAQMDWYKNHYLNSAEEALDPRVSPLLAKDLRDLPPAFIAVSGFDPLRDEAEVYAERLHEAGVITAVRRFEGTTHALIDATGVGTIAREMLIETAGALKVLIAVAKNRKCKDKSPE